MTGQIAWRKVIAWRITILPSRREMREWYRIAKRNNRIASGILPYCPPESREQLGSFLRHSSVVYAKALLSSSRLSLTFLFLTALAAVTPMIIRFYTSSPFYHASAGLLIAMASVVLLGVVEKKTFVIFTTCIILCLACILVLASLVTSHGCLVS